MTIRAAHSGMATRATHSAALVGALSASRNTVSAIGATLVKRQSSWRTVGKPRSANRAAARSRSSRSHAGAELPPARADEHAVAEHVHEIGNDVIEQTLVMRHHDERAIRRAHRIHAARDDLERIDIEARISFVENRERRLEHGHVEDFVALLLA